MLIKRLLPLFLLALGLLPGCGAGEAEQSLQVSALSPTCANGLKDGDETAVDCGGALCAPCAYRATCVVNSDCVTRSCAGGRCAYASCTDQVWNGHETDVDCGGKCAVKCAAGQKCLVGGDCVDKNCGAGSLCLAPSCTDGLRNGNESAVDCGGGLCAPCAKGLSCRTGSDCDSSVCTSKGYCASPSCTDGFKNGTETDVDCGGVCSPCATLGRSCLTGADCQTKVCTAWQCALPSCTDGAKNGTETDIDCGGTCRGCSNLGRCKLAADCASGVCSGTYCIAPPHCRDGKKNIDETDVDCGASCGVCPGGRACLVASDCVTGQCTGNVCSLPGCNDGMTNQDETGIDCGGTICPACAAGQPCRLASDCANGNSCTNRWCKPLVNRCANVICQALDACHVSGGCDPSTGQCTSPNAPDGTSCTLATGPGACESGVCNALSCAPGYEVVNGACSPVNSCLAANGGCDPNATCLTTGPGTNSCACNPGYVGDGATCAPDDPCLTGNGGCDPIASCENEMGAAVCTCPIGSTGNGQSCALDACIGPAFTYQFNGWWPGDGHTRDLASGHPGGALQGTAAYGPGVVGQGFAFDGGGAVTVPSGQSVSFSSMVTLVAWVRSAPVEGAAVATVIDKSDCGSGGYSLRIVGSGTTPVQGGTGDGRVSFQVASNAVSFVLNSNARVDDGQWHMISASKRYDYMRIYVDGVLDVSATPNGLPAAVRNVLSNGPSVNTQPLSLGAGSCTGRGLVGALDEVQVYNAVLEAPQVLSMYQAGVAGICRPLESRCSTLGNTWEWNGTACVDTAAIGCVATGGVWSVAGNTCQCAPGWQWQSGQKTCRPPEAQLCEQSGGSWLLSENTCNCTYIQGTWDGATCVTPLSGACQADGGNWTGNNCDCSVIGPSWSWDWNSHHCIDQETACYSGGGYWNGWNCDCWGGFWDGTQCYYPPPLDCGPSGYPDYWGGCYCDGGTSFDGTTCVCQQGAIWDPNQWMCVENCGAHGTWDGWSCTCEEGYRLESSCVRDCPPNSVEGGLPAGGGLTECICPGGYVASEDACIPPAAHQIAPDTLDYTTLVLDGANVFYRPYGANLYRAPLDGSSGATTLSTGVSTNGFNSLIPDGDTLWIASGGTIYKYSQSTGKREVFAYSFNGSISGIVADATSLYFPLNNRLYRASKAGGAPVIISQADAARPIGGDLRLLGNDFYWANQEGLNTVPITGGQRVQFLADSGPGYIRAFTSDATHLYYAMYGGDTGIMRVPLAGGVPQKLADRPDQHAYSLETDGTYLYWGADNGSIYRMPLGGGPPQVIASYLGRLFNVAVSHDWIVWNQADGGALFAMPNIP